MSPITLRCVPTSGTLPAAPHNLVAPVVASGPTPSRPRPLLLAGSGRERRLEELEEVNVLTAGDDRVCKICEDIAEDGPYLIDQARGLIPAHPRCRCAFEAA